MQVERQNFNDDNLCVGSRKDGYSEGSLSTLMI